MTSTWSFLATTSLSRFFYVLDSVANRVGVVVAVLLMLLLFVGCGGGGGGKSRDRRRIRRMICLGVRGLDVGGIDVGVLNL